MNPSRFSGGRLTILPSSQPPEDATDSLSRISVLSEPDVGMDDLVPSATGEPTPLPATTTTATSCALCGSVIEVQIVRAPGSFFLIETSPPALLSIDEDERPNWLLMSIKDLLKYGPYYMCLGRVVDLFLAQEARLGYLAKVSEFRSPRVSPANNFVRPSQSNRLALPCQNRPDEVAAFMKRARNFSRGDKVDATKFGAAVITWWRTIQPTARKDWPPTYKPLPDDFSFEYFNQGGPNGVFLVVLCLLWWANALTSDTDHTSFGLVVHDVHWVLEKIAGRA